MTKGKNKGLLERADRIARNCIANRVRVLNRVISALYNEQLSALGITVAQFNILTEILKRQPTSALEISSILELEKSSVSRSLDLMRSNGWISVKAAGRVSALSVAPAGEAIFRAALPKWKQAQRKTIDILGNGGARRLSDITRRVRKRQKPKRQKPKRQKP